MKTFFTKNKKGTKQGFALLFTVLIVSTILSLAIGISSITYKQNLLSSIAKDSQLAFFTADSGIECGLLVDLMGFTGGGGGDGYFPRGGNPAWVMSTFPASWCNDLTFSIDLVESTTSYYVYKENVSDQKKPCRIIVFDRTDPVINKIQSRGYSTCQNSPRQVERSLDVQYKP